MSSGTGETLVRSPQAPTIGTDHLGPPDQWNRMPASLPSSLHPQRLITKFPDCKNKVSVDGKSSRVLTQQQTVCSCGGWTQAEQLQHELAELQTAHHSVLEGLFEQIENLKQKNRDLTFQLIVKPSLSMSKEGNGSDAGNTSFCKTKTYLSPECKQECRPSLPEHSRLSTPSSSRSLPPVALISDVREDSAGESSFRLWNVKESRHGTLISSTGSTEFGIPQEEARITKKLLQEAKKRNEYLLNVIDKLKRQLKVKEASTSRRTDLGSSDLRIRSVDTNSTLQSAESSALTARADASSAPKGTLSKVDVRLPAISPCDLPVTKSSLPRSVKRYEDVSTGLPEILSTSNFNASSSQEENKQAQDLLPPECTLGGGSVGLRRNRRGRKKPNVLGDQDLTLSGNGQEHLISSKELPSKATTEEESISFPNKRRTRSHRKGKGKNKRSDT